MQNWDEIRTAFHVARLGTVSGAADVLGVHHATVIRHIDALEKQLGVRLFQRHARGYTATEAGRDLLSVAKATEEQFIQLSSRIKGQGETVSGELVVTSITGMSDLLAPVLTSFQALHPQIVVRFLTDMRLFRLDYGEAHVAIRAGDPPEEPDNVAQPLAHIRAGLYASRAYVEAHGLPKSADDFAQHRFIGADSVNSRAPFYRWMGDKVPPDCVTFHVTEMETASKAVQLGAGIGFIAQRLARDMPDLVEVLPPRPEWNTPLWIVTHVDLHRTVKVQSFLTHLKSAARAWTDI